MKRYDLEDVGNSRYQPWNGMVEREDGEWVRFEDLEKYKLAVQKYSFLVGLWLQEDCGCRCSECAEILEAADELMGWKRVEKEGAD